MNGLSKQTLARDGNYVVTDGQNIQPPTSTAGQVNSERSISVPSILNQDHYPLKFQRGLC